MKRFRKRYFPNPKDDILQHADSDRKKYGTANSTSTEKGKDGKLNNTSEYNHEYYEENKEKWKDNNKKSPSKKSSRSDDDDLFYDKDGKARFGHKDFDPNDPDFQRKDGTIIEGTGLRTFTNSNGSTIIVGNGIKFSFPPGTKITSAMAKKIAEAEKASGGNKEQYVAKMLNAVTGFADKQGLDTGGKKKSSKSTKSSSPAEEKQEEKKVEKSSSSEWDKTIAKYNGGEEKDESRWGETQRKAEEEKKKSVKHADDVDLGSILIADLFR